MFFAVVKSFEYTRMHSCRMRTVRCSGHLSCHTCPLPCTPPAMHAPHHACLPCEQNHRHLWKHNLAPTTLQMVKTCPASHVNWARHKWKSFTPSNKNWVVRTRVIRVKNRDSSYSRQTFLITDNTFWSLLCNFWEWGNRSIWELFASNQLRRRVEMW